MFYRVFKLNDVLTRFNQDAGKTLIAVCCSIGAADGNFDKEEVALVKEMCSNLGVNAAEDGDVVQIIDNGNPLGKGITLMHNAKTVTVPINGKVEVKGIKDGGGGITYALYVKETGETYFNNAPINGVNTYTITNSK